MNGWWLQLGDSELARAEPLDEHRLRLHWSAALLVRGPQRGWASGISLLIDGLPAMPVLDGLLGSVRDGRWQRLGPGGPWSPHLPLNQRCAGPLQLTLQLAWRLDWAVAAGALTAEGPAEPALREVLAC